jgi:hypothetical protein
MHESAPPHFLLATWESLNVFPVQQIGQGGPIAWPTHFPDLNPLDLYLWRHLKSTISHCYEILHFAHIHQTLTFRLCKRNLKNCMGIFKHQHVLLRLFIAPFNIKHASPEKTQFLDQKIHWLLFLKPEYWLLIYQSRGMRCFTTLILHVYSLSLLAAWQITLNSNWGQHFLGFVSIHMPISCNFSSVKTMFFLAF